MALKNTARDYGSVAKWLHWSMAALFLASYCTVYYRQWFTEEETPENWIALQLHLSVGLTLAALVALRIFWPAANRLPEPEPGRRIEQLAARPRHYTPYAMMVLMPVTGYIGTGVHTEYFLTFEIPKFADTRLFAWLVGDGLRMTFEEFDKPVDFIHTEVMGEGVVWLLRAGHILAAVCHHFGKKDRTIRKMTTGR